MATPNLYPIVVEDVKCSGDEPGIRQCKADLYDASKSQCSHAKDVQIRCTDEAMPGPCTDYEPNATTPKGYLLSEISSPFS